MNIRQKLIIPSISAWLVFVLLLNFYWQPLYLDNQKKSYEEHLSHEVQLLSAGLFDNLLQNNLAAMNVTLDKILEMYPSWTKVVVSDSEGKQLYIKNKIAGKSSNTWIMQDHSISYHGEHIATVSVYGDPSGHLQEQKDQIQQLNFYLVLLLAIAVVISTKFQSSIIIGPLKELSTATKNIANGDFSRELPVAKSDEIGELSHSFRTMINNLKLALEEIQEENEIISDTAKKLQESESRFSRAIKGSNDGIWEWDIDTGYCYFSPKWISMLGYKENEIEPSFKAWRELIHPDDLGEFLLALTDFLDGITKIFSFEYRILKKNGDYATVYCRGLLSFGDDSEQIWFAGSQSDITQRRILDEKLLLQANALEAAEEGIVITDQNGVIQWLNPAFTTITGFRKEDILYKNIQFMETAEEDSAYINQAWDCVRSGTTWNGELWKKKKNGELYREDQSITPIVEGDGEIKHCILIIRDITYKRTLQEQLQQAQKMEAIGQLTGGIAHDFNNMLASIMGFNQLALEGVKEYEDERLSRYLGEVDKASKRARDLISQMLAFSRNQRVESSPMLIAPLARESLKMLETVLPSTIELNVDINDDIDLVNINSVQLNQVVLNLCINARDAMENKGTINIGVNRKSVGYCTCSSCQHDFTGDFVELSIRDSGSGISANQLQYIFEPFFTSKPTGKGTGMGLSMVHGIMHDLGGHICVQSEEGKGASFNLLFPVISRVKKESEVAQLDAKKIQKIYKPRHILLIDDEVSISNYISGILTDHGYLVNTQKDGLSSYQEIKNFPEKYDLVLMDLDVQGMTGIELARLLINLDVGIPIIIYANPDEHEKLKALSTLPIAAYLNKPIDNESMISAIEECLTRKENVAIN